MLIYHRGYNYHFTEQSVSSFMFYSKSSYKEREDIGSDDIVNIKGVDAKKNALLKDFSSPNICDVQIVK